GGVGSLFNRPSFYIESPGEHERHWKTECNCGDNEWQDPLRRVVSGDDRRANLDDEPGNYCVAHRDAIDLPLFQLTEERAHLFPFAYVASSPRHKVELANGAASNSAAAHIVMRVAFMMPLAM